MMTRGRTLRWAGGAGAEDAERPTRSTGEGGTRFRAGARTTATVSATGTRSDAKYTRRGHRYTVWPMASNGDRAQSAMAPRDALWGASWTATLVRPASDGISGGSRTRWRFQDTWASAADDLVCLQKKCPSGGSGAALRTTPPRTHARYHEQQNPRKDQEGGPDEPQVHRHQGRLEVRARARKRHFPIAERLVRAPKKPTRTIPPPTLTPRRPAFPRDSQGQGSQGDEGSVQA